MRAVSRSVDMCLLVSDMLQQPPNHRPVLQFRGTPEHLLIRRKIYTAGQYLMVDSSAVCTLARFAGMFEHL